MNRKGKMKIVFICAALVLALVILYSGLHLLESTVLFPGQNSGTVDTKWIVRDGVRYYPRQDIVVVLITGTDHEGKMTGTEADRGHTADMIALLIFDEKAQTGELLLLNRDTMVKMKGLDETGREKGTYYAQLAVSHAFGTGGADSCENVRNTVSNMLYGIHIDYYVSMNMGGIATLNDAVGGVTVQVTDDFYSIDPTIGMGEVTLNGQQAYNFIRSRKGLGDQMNVSRMERHKAYFTGLMDALRKIMEEDACAAVTVYEQISPYIVMDCSVNALTGMMERYADYQLVGMVSPEGENIRGEQHMEFYLDEDKLDALILQLFYAPK